MRFLEPFGNKIHRIIVDLELYLHVFETDLLLAIVLFASLGIDKDEKMHSFHVADNFSDYPVFKQNFETKFGKCKFKT